MVLLIEVAASHFVRLCGIQLHDNRCLTQRTGKYAPAIFGMGSGNQCEQRRGIWRQAHQSLEHESILEGVGGRVGT
ncbi:hypothetical protein D3C81_1094030 [compost metagenome]